MTLMPPRHARADVIGRELGTIELGAETFVADPCYDRDTKHADRGFLLTTPGKWYVEVDIIRATGDPWNLAIMHEDFLYKHSHLRFHPVGFEIGVDSGQVGFFDSHYHKQVMDTLTATNLFYEEVCAITNTDRRAGIISGGWGAVSGTCYGDGAYSLLVAHAKRDKTGPIVSAFINFAMEGTE